MCADANVEWQVLFDHVEDANVGLLALNPGEAQVSHYHKEGADIFIISEGEGVLQYGDVDPETRDLSNPSELAVKKGDIYFAAPWQMHALVNTGAQRIT